jgi:hypothetical protein
MFPCMYNLGLLIAMMERELRLRALICLYGYFLLYPDFWALL